MLVVRRALVVAAFAVAGICYVSGSEKEDIYTRKKEDLLKNEEPREEEKTYDAKPRKTEGTENIDLHDSRDSEGEKSAGNESGIHADLKAENTTKEETEVQEPLTTQNNKININTAGEEELTALNGIGTAKARRIIEFRTVNGEFKSLEELMLVPGIKEGTFSKIKDDISF